MAAAKVGPDFIDPGYHALATGRSGRNLDSWLCGETVIPALAARAANGADVLIVEGVMGLFDGVGATSVASTAHIATLLDAPVLLVVDAASISASVAAVVHGFASFDPEVTVAGVVLNRVGSDNHEAILRRALAPLNIPVLGALRRDDNFSWRDRHLGLIPVVERPDEVRASLDRLADAIAAHVDLDAVRRLAESAPRRSVPPPPEAEPATETETETETAGGRCRIAVAAGPVFSFGYADNLELLAGAGAEIVLFDPLRDQALPEGIGGLVAGGGFPEVFAAALADNHPLLADTRRRVGNGLVTWAECGGLLWLGEQLDGHRLCGAIATTGRLTERLTLGYRTATFRSTTPLGPEGSVVRGHEFHYSSVEPPGDALSIVAATGATGTTGTTHGGWATPTLMASYLHLHLAGAPHLATEFVRRAAARSFR